MNATSNNARVIFLEAIELPTPSERAEFLDRACEGDSDLRARVERLLQSHDLLGTFHDIPAATIDPPPITEQAGTVVGPYKLLQQIGEGGMGVVFMAEQSQPIQRTVALKIIKPGMDTRHVIARFEAERQALAMMDHPNIAKVLDAGTTNSGRPYFVMELVKGVPITKYCDEKQLTLRERLELLKPVCEAVQHAHQKGIIHRDIKPTNVLVAEYDNHAAPKVIDFGVAKATAQKLTERTMFTEFGQVIGTVEYMSPEQAKFNQLDIDTRSDIYSLGVLLYELLTGSTPFEQERLREAAFDEVLRIIREEEPPRPSTRLSTSETLPSIAANRHTEPARLSRDVSGELDWIVMKCLEKDRNRRYETAAGLLRDIERYLQDEPVQACPPTTWYRFRKFAKRHKTAFGVGSVAAALLTALVAASTIAHRSLVAEQTRAIASEAQAARLNIEQQQSVLEKVLLQAMSGDFDGAEKSTGEAESLHTSPGQIDMLRGLVAYERGDIDPAISHLPSAIKLIPAGQPGAVAAPALLVLTYAKSLHGKDLYAVYRDLEPLSPISLEDYLFKGLVEAMSDDGGLHNLDEAARLRPESSVIRALRTQARADHAMRTGEARDAELALEDAQLARTMLPGSLLVLQQSIFAQLVAAGIYEGLGRSDDRTRVLAQARRDVEEMQRFASTPLAAQARFDFFDCVGDEESAYAMSQHGADIRQVVMLYRRGELAKAIEVVNHNLTLDHGFSMSPVERGFILAELPDGAAQARVAFQEASDLAEYFWRMTPPMILLFLGEKNDAIQASRKIRENPPEVPVGVHDWYLKYLDYNCDLISADELLKSADSDRLKQCEARFAIGLRRLANGDRAGAREHFQKCVDTRVFPLWEYTWARAFLARMEKEPAWPPWIH